MRPHDVNVRPLARRYRPPQPPVELRQAPAQQPAKQQQPVSRKPSAVSRMLLDSDSSSEEEEIEQELVTVASEERPAQRRASHRFAPSPRNNGSPGGARVFMEPQRRTTPPLYLSPSTLRPRSPRQRHETVSAEPASGSDETDDRDRVERLQRNFGARPTGAASNSGSSSRFPATSNGRPASRASTAAASLDHSPPQSPDAEPAGAAASSATLDSPPLSALRTATAAPGSDVAPPLLSSRRSPVGSEGSARAAGDVYGVARATSGAVGEMASLLLAGEVVLGAFAAASSPSLASPSHLHPLISSSPRSVRSDSRREFCASVRRCAGPEPEAIAAATREAERLLAAAATAREAEAAAARKA
eukprot:7388514-Prymnesium_polylepis.4